jgi:copper(I)-binding protein
LIATRRKVVGSSQRVAPGRRDFGGVCVGARSVRGRRIAAAILAIAALATTSACAAGKHAQTAEETPTVDGTAGIVGALHLNEVAIAAPTAGPSYPAGSAVQVLAAIVNTGTTADQLVGVSAAGASGSALYASAADAAAVLTPTSSVSVSAGSSSSTPAGTSTSSSVSVSSSVSSSVSASASASASSSSGAALNSLALPAGELTGLGLTPTDDVLVLTGLSATLFPGTTLAITFRFATAGTITLQVPVMLTTSAITPLSVPPLPSESAAG